MNISITRHNLAGACGLCDETAIETVDIVAGKLINGPVCASCLFALAQRVGGSSTNQSRPNKSRTKPPSAPPLGGKPGLYDDRDSETVSAGSGSTEPIKNGDSVTHA